MMRRFTLIVFVVAWSAAAFAGPGDEALAAYHALLASFTTENHVRLAVLFAPHALFYGTGSAHVVTTPEGVIAYPK